MSQLIQYASLRPAPWKNGGGSTTEMAVHPRGASIDSFNWRISLATIAHSGPFSAFPGIDRTLALVNGGGVLLDFGASRTVLSDSEPVVSFAGETPVHATVASGSTTDFNVMTRRGHCRHKLERLALRGQAALPRRSGTTFVFLAEGECATLRSATECLALVRYDAVLLEADGAWQVEAQQAMLFVVDLIPH